MAKACAAPDRQLLLLPADVFDELGLKDDATLAARLPFVGADATVGMENELQAAVVGHKSTVDLPQTILASDFYANLLKRHGRGELPRTAIARLEEYIEERDRAVWENSWVRFPRRTLLPETAAAFKRDLLYDKTNPSLGMRGDAGSFCCEVHGEEFLRVPVSYLLKLALLQAVASQPWLPGWIKETAQDLTEAFISDNTSPEINSFYVVSADCPRGLGEALSRETAKRYLLMQLLIEYSREVFELDLHGQRPAVYFAPTPPRRQQLLNEGVSDAFYRDLFMSPCLSGWDCGEEKKRYMHLCHQVLSRSHLNTLAKLRDAGIINNNLVVLPNTSNISLANNGAHISLGSRKLSRALADRKSPFTSREEKFYGDLVIKFVEHFLPLLVGLYSAAPRRLGFEDFHPERALGFLPHELDYTHLRMLWRRWKKKADLRFCGYRWTPLGPPWMDRLLGIVFRLRGDLVPDFRLIDYLACLQSTEQSPGLDGRPGNSLRLKRNLEELGVFDQRMACYLLYRQREHATMGFTGFEGRFYSLFPSLRRDLAAATDLQALLTALAYKLIIQRRLSHASIPDDPSTESERRQIFFAAALDVPTFFVRQSGPNTVLHSLIARTANVRLSRRYSRYLRVQLADYRRALVQYLRSEAGDVIEAMQLHSRLDDLEQRIEAPECNGAGGRLVRDILGHSAESRPIRVPAREFNAAAEAYYRNELRCLHIAEGLEILKEDLDAFEAGCKPCSRNEGRFLKHLLGGGRATIVVSELGSRLRTGQIKRSELVRLMNLLLVSIHRDMQMAARLQAEENGPTE
jgi:hypothetical protein